MPALPDRHGEPMESSKEASRVGRMMSALHSETLPTRRGSRVEIVEYTKQDLEGLLADDFFWAQPRLPITKRRALSHIFNPRAEENDTVLITASAEGQLIAYLGLLPDWWVQAGQAPIKFAWTSAWWVDKQSKYRSSAAMILLTALERYSNRIAGSSPSDQARRVGDASRQFRYCVKFQGSYFVMAPPPSFRGLSSATKWFVSAKNRITFRTSLQERGLEIQTVDAFNAAAESFINTQAVDDPFARDSKYWKWVLDYPWMSATEEDKIAQERYAFSVFAKDFRQIPMFVSRQGVFIAFFLMTVRDGRLILKYAYYAASDAVDVAIALQAVVAEINPWLFVCGDPVLNAAFKRSFRFYFARFTKSSTIYAASGLPVSLGHHIHWGSGDLVFT